MQHAPGQPWPTAPDGQIGNAGDAAHLRPPFAALLRDIVQACVANIGPDVDTIYVTGSVARGRAVPGRSDVDVFAVLEAEADPELVMQDWLEEAELHLPRLHPCVSAVQIELWPYGYVFMDPDEFSVGAFIIKTHSVCIWGSSLAPQLPDYYLPRDLVAIANDDVVQIRPDIAETLEELEHDSSADSAAYWCRRISKNMLRAGLGLVQPAAGLHTRDLDLCYEHFARHHPGQGAAMHRALDYVERPASDANELRAYLHDFGGWLRAAAEQWLDQHNPRRHLAFRFVEEDDEEV